jgi:hypothetical protein
MSVSDRDRAGAFEALSPTVAATTPMIIAATGTTGTPRITPPTQRLLPAIPPSGAIRSHRSTILLLNATKKISKHI